MKILVVGRGWVGKMMEKELSRNEYVPYQQFIPCVVRSCSHQEAYYELSNWNYDWVVNCAGVTGTPNVDACEDDKQNTIEGNAYYPIRLFETCRKNNVRFAHFSSGCIYQGEIDDGYAAPNFFGSTYSLSKGISDYYLTKLTKDALVFRVRMPFEIIPSGKNLLDKIDKYAKTGKLYEGGPNSITNITEAVNKAAFCIRNNMRGPFNLVNRGSVTMKRITELMGLTDVNWYTEEEFKSATKAGRSNCVIPSSALMSSVEESLVNTIKNWKLSKEWMAKS